MTDYSTDVYKDVEFVSDATEKIRLAIVNVEQNRDVIFHNMRSMSFVDGLLMGLQYGFEISAFGETDLDVEELSK